MEGLVVPNGLSVFSGKRVILTGDTGFKGSWLALWLRQLGADVVGIGLPPVGSMNLFQLARIDQQVHHLNLDIRELEQVKPVFEKFKPEFVFHLAAQALVRPSYEDPKTTFDTNVGGSLNILECVRATPEVRSVIYVTTDKCYKNKEWIWGYRENDELGGKDPYSASKAAAEILFSSYEASFFNTRPTLGISSVRAGNVVGGGDWAEDRIVPDIIKAVTQQKDVVLRNPEAVRPWQHVLDPIYAYLILASRQFSEPKKYSGSWNFGPEFASNRTVWDLANKVIQYWGSGRLVVQEDSNKVHEAKLLQLNCDKAKIFLEWNPIWDFEKTVRHTVEWYKTFYEDVPALLQTQRQIRKFMKELSND